MWYNSISWTSFIYFVLFTLVTNLSKASWKLSSIICSYFSIFPPSARPRSHVLSLLWPIYTQFISFQARELSLFTSTIFSSYKFILSLIKLPRKPMIDCSKVTPWIEKSSQKKLNLDWSNAFDIPRISLSLFSDFSCKICSKNFPFLSSHVQVTNLE